MADSSKKGKGGGQKQQAPSTDNKKSNNNNNKDQQQNQQPKQQNQQKDNSNNNNNNNKNQQNQQPKDNNKNQQNQQPKQQQQKTDSKPSDSKDSKKEEVSTPTPSSTPNTTSTPSSTPNQQNPSSNQQPQRKDANPKQAREYIKGRGTVKAVPSGDSLTINIFEKNKPPTTMEISLSNIQAPKLFRKAGKDKEKRDRENKDKEEKKDQQTHDDEFAFASREFLRKTAIGKTVSYTIESKGTSKGGREFGVVYLLSKDEKELTDLAQLVVKEGWATVRKRENPNAPVRADVEELQKLEEAARKAEKGVHNKNKNGSIRPTNLDFNPPELYEKLKGAPQHGIVERVLTGSYLILTLLPSYHEVKLILSGVECPAVPNVGEAEPFGREAKFVTEHFLLHRDVNVILEGADRLALFGTLDYSGNNISEELLKRGLAKYVEWSGSRTAFADKLKAAEKSAKERKLALWSNFVEPKQLSRQEEKKQYRTGKEISGKVTQVSGPGSIVVVDGSGTEHQVNLSSIVVKRAGNMRPKEKGDKDEKDTGVVGEAPKEKSTAAKDKDKKEREEALERTWAWEAKDYLRKRLIGQRVRCVLDYIQPPVVFESPRQGGKKGSQREEKPQDRNYFSVYLDKNNVAVELVAAGLATTRFHRGGEQRSKDYEDILKAEGLAKKMNRGQHMPEDRASVLYINDITGDANKAKGFLPSLKRGRQRGVIVHVFNAARYKIYVPKESCELAVSLSGLKAPKSTPTPEPYSQQSIDWAKDRVLQRDVEFEVSQVDRGGSFVGNIWIGKDNLSVMVVQEGYAKILRGILSESESFADLDIAENVAKKNKKGVWENYDEVAEMEEREKKRGERNANNNNSKQEEKDESIRIMVTEIVDAGTFYIQIIGEDTDKLDKLMADLASDDTNVPNFVPKFNELVKAQFTADDKWYRAQVQSVEGNTAKVLYVDYGNSEVLPLSRVQPLSSKFTTLKNQAVLAHLAFLKPPTLSDDYGHEAAEFLKELVEGKTLTANVEYYDSLGGTNLTFGDDDFYANAELVKAGLSKVKKPKKEKMLKPKNVVDQMVNQLKEEEKYARSSHSCIWEYGDPGSDDDATEETKLPGVKKAVTASKKPTGSPATEKKE